MSEEIKPLFEGAARDFDYAWWSRKDSDGGYSVVVLRREDYESQQSRIRELEELAREAVLAPKEIPSEKGGDAKMSEVKPIFEGWPSGDVLRLHDGYRERGIVVLRTEDWEHCKQQMAQFENLKADVEREMMPSGTDDASEGPSGANETGFAPPICETHKVQCAEEREAGQKWEPGMVVNSGGGSPKYRLDEFVEAIAGVQDWKVTDLSTGKQEIISFKPSFWEIHRRPHEFKVGDWFECAHCNDGKHQVTELYSIRGAIESEGFHEHQFYDCRHVPAPAESKLAAESKTLTGPNWDTLESGHYATITDLTKCCMDLREQVEKLMKEGKR